MTELDARSVDTTRGGEGEISECQATVQTAVSHPTITQVKWPCAAVKLMTGSSNLLTRGEIAVKLYK